MNTNETQAKREYYPGSNNANQEQAWRKAPDFYDPVDYKYHDQCRAAGFDCPACKWHGLGSELLLGGTWEECFDYACPSCGECLLVLAFPNMDEHFASLYQRYLSKREHGGSAGKYREEFERGKLREPSQVPDMMKNSEPQPNEGIKFPKPDRSNFQPNRFKTDDWPEFDISWQEGVLFDGRPFRVEFWARDNVSFLTLFVPAEGIDLSTDTAAARYVEWTGLIRFLSGQRECCARKFTDPSGHEMWSITVVVGDEYNTYIESRLQLQRYT
jgi:hypothetical protein